MKAGPAVGGHRRRQAVGHRGRRRHLDRPDRRACPPPRKGQWISRVEAGAPRRRRSPTWRSTRTARGNYAPLAYRTADRGRTWQRIAGDLPAGRPGEGRARGPAERRPALRGHRVRRSSRASTAARHWAQLGGLPTVAVDDILVHPRDRDLVVGHARPQPLRPRRHRAAAGADAPRCAPRTRTCSRRGRPRAFHLLPGFADWAGSAASSAARTRPRARSLTLLGQGVHRRAGEDRDHERGAASRWRTSRRRRARPQPRDLGPEADQGRAHASTAARARCSSPAGEYKVTLTHGKAKDEQKLKVEIAPGRRDALIRG